MNGSNPLLNAFEHIHRGGRKLLSLPHLQKIRVFCTIVPSRNVLNYNRDTGIISEERDNASNPLYHTVIGIEIHAQLSVPTKLFSSSPTKHHKEVSHYTDNPNTSISAHDIGYPGTLPILSRKSVQYAVLSAAALNCKIQKKSRFERKHYFYPDLPLGYQVTQQRWPLAKDGTLICRRFTLPQAKDVELSKFFDVGIDRIQIEQDTGKTTTITRETEALSLIDFNRAGSTLIEIVFKPQIKSAHEAASVASTVQSLLKHIGTCDGKMEDGSLRVDLNVSIAPVQTEDDLEIYPKNTNQNNPFQQYLPLGAGNRVEVKNLNSLRQIIQSVEYEGIRQAKIRMSGDWIGQETRTFDPKNGITIKLRDKGDAVDYRFMPEPDLPPLILNEEAFNGKKLEQFLSDELPELPEEAINRLMDEFDILEAAALVIVSDKPAISFFEEAVRICIENLKSESAMKMVAVSVSNWLCNDLFALVKESALRKETSPSDHSEIGDEEHQHPISIQYSNVSAERLGILVSLVLNEIVSTKQAKKLLNVMYTEDLVSDPHTIANERGWKLISDRTELKELCRKSILDPKHQKQLDQYSQGGKNVQKMKKYFIGKIMAASQGNAHPELLQDALDETLEEISPDVK